VGIARMLVSVSLDVKHRRRASFRAAGRVCRRRARLSSYPGKPPMGPAMVFRVEAKTALAEARSWVRIARGRLEELSKESEQPQALAAMAAAMTDMQASIEAIEHRLSHVDNEWQKLYQPPPTRSALI
jgi:hypothetical protein